MSTTKTKPTKAVEPSIDAQIASARLVLNTLLCESGSDTTEARANLTQLLERKAAIDADAARESERQHAAEQSDEQARAQRIADAASELQSQRDARLSALAQRFAVRPIPSAVHA
jgi:hypothetical protein